MKRIAAFFLLLLSLESLVRAQTFPGTPNPGQILGNYTTSAALAAPVNWMATGTSCPSWLSTYQMLANTASSPIASLTIYDGTSCVVIGTLNGSAHTFIPSITGASGSGVTLSGSTISNSSITGGSVLGAAIQNSSVTGLPNPINPTDAVPFAYVQNIQSGVWVHQSVLLATTGALPSNTYNNGSSGVGATLTATANGALTVDGTAASVGNRILADDEAAAAHNGVYTVSQAGNGSTPYILTRATDANTVGTGANSISLGTFVLVASGSVNANTGWIVNAPIATIGTSAITWAQFSAAPSVQASFFTPEQYGAVADGGLAFVTLTASSPTIGGFTFPAEAVSKSVPFVCYGCGANGTTINGTVAGSTSLSINSGITQSAYVAARAFVSTANSTSGNAVSAGDVFTVSDSRVTCATAPQFTVQWISNADISLSVTTAGSCSQIPTGAPTTPITVTSNGSGSSLSVWIIWSSSNEYAYNALVNTGGSGYTNGETGTLTGLSGCSVAPQFTLTVSGGAISNMVISRPGLCPQSSLTALGMVPGRLTGGIGITGGTSGATNATAFMAFNTAGLIAYGTDNFAALGNLATGVQNAGGGQIQFKAGGTYAVRTSTPQPSDGSDAAMVFQPTSPLNGVSVEGNGAAVLDARHYGNGSGNTTFNTSYVLEVDGQSTAPINGFSLRNLSLIEAEPQAHWITGGALLVIGGSVTNSVLENINAIDALALVQTTTAPTSGVARCSGVVINNGFTFNTEYGFNAQANCDNVMISGLNLFEPGRGFFPYGISGLTIRGAAVQNPQTSPTFLGVSAPAVGTSLGDYNWDVTLTIRPTVGGDTSAASYIWLEADSGGVFDAVHIHAHYNGRGDGGGSGLFDCTRLSAPANSIWRDVTFDGTISNVGNGSAVLVNCPDNSASWTTAETFKGVKIGPFTTDGNSTPTEYSDLGSFTTNDPLTIENTSVVGAWSFVNATGTNLRQVAFNNAGTLATPGQILSQSLASGSAISLTNTTPANLTSGISLPIGQWALSLAGLFNYGASNAGTQLASISTTSATLNTNVGFLAEHANSVNGASNESSTIPPIQVTVSTPTTYYPVMQGNFGSGTMTVYGTLQAQRLQ